MIKIEQTQTLMNEVQRKGEEEKKRRGGEERGAGWVWGKGEKIGFNDSMLYINREVYRVGE